MSTFPSDEVILRTQALIAELENQSDRGVAIVGVAWIEEALNAAIESFLVKDKRSWDRLFRKSGPLSSLSARIDLARLLGMTSKAITSDLHILREIRNEFAHSVLAEDNVAPTFATPHIRDKCLAIRAVAHEKHTDPKHAFVRACAVLNSDFYLHQFMGQAITDGGQVRAFSE